MDEVCVKQVLDEVCNSGGLADELPRICGLGQGSPAQCLSTRPGRPMDLVRSGLILFLAAGAVVAYLRLSARNKGRSTSGPQSSVVQEPSAKRRPPETKQSRSRLPLEILYPEQANGPAEVDIIAVHGLGSNVDWSWTWKEGDKRVNWLREPDMLPAKAPKSRIMLYSYESRWDADAPKTRLQLCGEELIHSGHNCRNGMLDRPIIFIGHSLGGLLVQHGLLYADRNESFRYLPGLTVGFVALGSLFRGTKMQSIADLAAQFMVLAGSHRGIIADPAFDNPHQRDRLQEFCQVHNVLLL